MKKLLFVAVALFAVLAASGEEASGRVGGSSASLSTAADQQTSASSAKILNLGGLLGYGYNSYPYSTPPYYNRPSPYPIAGHYPSTGGAYYPNSGGGGSGFYSSAGWSGAGYYPAPARPNYYPYAGGQYPSAGAYYPPSAPGTGLGTNILGGVGGVGGYGGYGGYSGYGGYGGYGGYLRSPQLGAGGYKY